MASFAGNKYMQLKESSTSLMHLVFIKLLQNDWLDEVIIKESC